MKKSYTRRDFLRVAAAGLSALAFEQFLAACDEANPTEPPASQAGEPATQPPTSTNSAASPATAASTQAGAQATPPGEQTLAPSETSSGPTVTPPGSPDLVVARNGEPEEMVRRALASLGGMEHFVPKGAKVVIKPNICVAYHTYEYAATTNPWLVAALVKMVFEAGASSVKVMDYPFGGTAQGAYERSGIAEQVKAAGGEMAFMPGFKYVSVDIPDGKSLKKTKVFQDVLDADVLINVPIAKTHSLAGLTLGMKNLMGVIADRQAIHSKLGQRLADLTSLLHPQLTVVDAVRVLVANGPTGGNLDDVKKMDTIIASPDIVAADSYATSLFGLTPEDTAYIPAAVAMGLGRSDVKNLKIEEIQVGA
jgi:uncharacterized protein (DUF362 family)